MEKYSLQILTEGNTYAGKHNVSVLIRTVTGFSPFRSRGALCSTGILFKVLQEKSSLTRVVIGAVIYP